MDSPIKSGEHYQFVKTDYADPTGDYTITIETDAGQRRVLTRDASLPDHFGIHEDEFFLDVTNWVRIQGTADCGKTGYSNAASLTPEGTGGGCLEETSASRDNFSDGDPSVLKVEAMIGGCDPSYLYNGYYHDPSTGNTFLLTQSPVSLAQLVFQDQPPSAGHGEYWFTAVDQMGQEVAQSPVVTEDERNVGADLMSSPGESSRNLNYVTWDHLGSTRVVTDERGVVVEQRKFYPFGTDALTPPADETRMAFTGHERDTALDLDYMLARYYGASLARFLSVDPVGGSAGTPQSWNGYAYTLNNALKFIDPDGRTYVVAGDPVSGLADIRRGLAPADRGAVSINRIEGTGSDLRVTIDANALNVHSSDSANFGRLRDIANSSETVVLDTSASSVTVNTPSGSQELTFDAGPDPTFHGITLPPTGTADYSGTDPNATQVFVNPNDNPTERSATVHHENVHAARGVSGQDPRHETGPEGGPVNRETKAAEEEARRNAGK
jgi:RHS repeat-associated protein